MNVQKYVCRFKVAVHMFRRRSTYVIAAAIFTAGSGGYLLGQWNAQPYVNQVPASYECEQMSLLTWKGWTGDLRFLLIPMVQRDSALRNMTIKWSGQSGVTKLKQALAAVPKNKYVQWNNWPRKFQYPSSQFCDELIAFCKTQGVQFGLNPTLDADIFTDWQPH